MPPDGTEHSSNCQNHGSRVGHAIIISIRPLAHLVKIGTAVIVCVGTAVIVCEGAGDSAGAALLWFASSTSPTRKGTLSLED